MTKEKDAGVYAGSFNPITKGHTDVILQAARVLPKLYVVVGENDEKTPLFTKDECVDMIRHEIDHVVLPALKAEGRSCDIVVTKHEGLTAAFMRANNAPFYVRGMRSDRDFTAEQDLMYANKVEYPDLKGMFFLASTLDMKIISSSFARGFAAGDGQSVGYYVSPYVEEKVRARFAEKKALRPKT